MFIMTFKRNSSILSAMVLGLLSFFITTNTAAAFQGPLRVSPTNPRYFTDDSGIAIYITGSHTWSALVDSGPDDPPAPFDLASYLTFLDQHHHNFIRFWSWDAPAAREGATYDYSTPQPWPRTGPGTAWDGKPKFDLNSFDDEYFTRLRQRVIDVGIEGICANVTLFEGWYLASQKAGSNNDGWSSHPFRSINNINGIDADTNGDGHGYEFYTLNAPPSVVDIQKAYVSRVLDTVNDLDNVLYEIVSQAATDSVQWQYMMIDFVKQEMAARGKTHPVGMSDTYLQSSNTDFFNSPADWISPGTGGGYLTSPPAANGTKLILLDSDHLWGFDQNKDSSSWVWKSFTRGNNIIYMDDPGVATVNLEKSRRAMGDTLRYAEKMDLNAMVPSTTLCSTAYCLQNAGKEYLVYQPSSGGFNLTVVAGTYSYEWFNPNTNAVAQTGTMTLAGGSRSFTPPFSGAAVLYLSNVPDNTPPSAPTNLMAAVITSSQVNLAWTASTDNVGIAGYKIYRDGVLVATTTATSYPNNGLTQSTTYTYQVSAFDAAGNDSPLSTAITVTTLGINIIPKTNWKLKSVDSQETVCENGAGVNAFDNNNATFWHTKWCGGNPPPPHEIQIDLGGVYNIDGFRYLPRQDGEVNGRIGKYEFYVSADGVNWGSAVATGTFANTATEKEVRFTASAGRYVRLRALTEVNDNPWTSMAEINVLGTAVAGNQAPNGVIDSPSQDMTINVGGTVNFTGTGSDPDNNLPLTFLWNFGTGSGVPNSTLEAPGTLAFNNAGTFTVTFTVTDSLGLSDPTPASRVITVITPGSTVIPKTNWKLKSVDSQETTCENGAGVNAFDNNNATFWHTKWCGSNPPPPHEIQINLGGVYNIDGFRYLPRQDGEVNGRIGQYEFYVSADGVNWGSAVATGTFANTAAEKEVRFTGKSGQYIRLRALTEANGRPWTSMAEINVLGMQ